MSFAMPRDSPSHAAASKIQGAFKKGARLGSLTSAMAAAPATRSPPPPPRKRPASSLGVADKKIVFNSSHEMQKLSGATMAASASVMSK